MRKRKTLSSFIPPLYSTAKIGSIVIDEPAPTTAQGSPSFNGTNKNCPKCGGHDLIRDMPANRIHISTNCRFCGYSVTTLLKETANAPRDETPDLTTAEMDKLAGDEKPVLPELKSGDILRHRNGYSLYRVYRVNNSMTGAYIEPLYRLEKIDTIRIKGHGLFTLDELNEQGMKLEE